MGHDRKIMGLPFGVQVHGVHRKGGKSAKLSSSIQPISAQVILISQTIVPYISFTGMKGLAGMDNPLAYIRESKVGVAQIRWLSELMLFDFDIKYRRGKSNKAADALSHHPYDSEEVDSNPESEEYETILYAIECEELEEILDGEKIP